MMGKGCVDLISTLRMFVDKHLEREKKFFAAFIDLDEAYDKVEVEGKLT